jgi:uncharacterized membrane protein YgdD (TMEM256/DUF423 family)
MNYTKIACALGALSVILGAFAAHILRELLTSSELQTFETGVRYQFYHTLALLFCAFATTTHNPRKVRLAVIFFLCGIIFFSGSLYLLSLKTILGLHNIRWIGPVTPIGGLMFIAGWITLFISSANTKKFNNG